MRRLSIIDLDHGRQPITNESGEVVVFQNGEIYNYAALRESLIAAGHTMKTQSDTEVIAHLYEDADGDVEFFARLRGMFAIAIWDRRKRRLVLGRDRFGIKPLLLARHGDELAFSSELGSLLRSGVVPPRVSARALEEYLRFNWIPDVDTILEDIECLAPGHALVVEDGRLETRRFATAGRGGLVGRRSGSTDNLVDELVATLRDSVAAHLVADVPVGVLLSGGVDSSLLAALAAEQTSDLKTFSIGFEDRRFNELPRARQTAGHLGTDHHELVVDPDLTLLMDQLVEAFDQPLGDSSSVPSFLVSQLAAGHVKVVLAGDGGDEMFAGYNSYAADSLARWVGPAAAAVAPLVDRFPDTDSRYPDRAKRFVRGAALPAARRHRSWLEVSPAEEVTALLAGGVRAEVGDDKGDFFARRYAESEEMSWLTRLQDLDVGGYLVDDLLMKADLASMAHSLEVRVPYVDHLVAEFAYGLEPRVKLRGLRKKWLLKEAARRFVPEQILKAPKQGFSIPAASWLRTDLREYATDILSEETLARQGFFDPAMVQSIYREHIERREDHSRRLWGLLAFTLWADRFGASPA